MWCSNYREEKFMRTLRSKCTCGALLLEQPKTISVSCAVRVDMAANGIKKTTSLVGYAVVPNARDMLCSLYAKTLSVVQTFPRDSGYRRHCEQVVQQRLQIVQADSSLESIESKIGCGQMEELIDQAERELSLAVKMEEWKPWEPLIAEPPPNQWKWP